MRRWVQNFTKLTAVLSAALFLSIGIADRYTADRYFLKEGETLTWKEDILSVEETIKQEELSVSSLYTNRKDVQLKLFHAIPVKTVEVSRAEEERVVLCGTPFGIRMFTNGVMVVDLAEIFTETGPTHPAEEAGIKIGDIIVSINGTAVNENEEIAEYCKSSGGESLYLQIIRGEETMEIELTPVYSKAEQCYKAGMWVRDSTAGIGTLTFYDTNSGRFGGLGHGICDFDTAELMPLRSGDILPVTISGVTKGKRGSPGELRGYFSEDTAIGDLYANTESGVYGSLKETPEGIEVEVGLKQSVCTGDVQIYTTVDNGPPQYYDACIEAVNFHGDGEGKNFVLRITDEDLLEKTGGIVQGMSGSPILQNGKLIGAVTHVFVNDPTRGYGIFAENMLFIAKETPEIPIISQNAA